VDRPAAAVLPIKEEHPFSFDVSPRSSLLGVSGVVETFEMDEELARKIKYENAEALLEKRSVASM